MTEKTVVHVMRHGEVHNPDKILYGRLPDYHLSDRGRAQAQAVADWLALRDVVYVVGSPLERAQETADDTGADRSPLRRFIDQVRMESLDHRPEQDRPADKVRNVPGRRAGGVQRPGAGWIGPLNVDVDA